MSPTKKLMECDDVVLLQRWVSQWRDLGDFEIVPVSPVPGRFGVVPRDRKKPCLIQLGCNGCNGGTLCA